MNSVFYRIVPTYSILGGYVHHSNLDKIYACIFNSHRISTQVLCSSFLTSMGFHACMFNSHRICAQILCYIGSVPAYSIPGGYVHHSNLDKICAYIFNSCTIYVQGLYSDLLDYF